MTCPLTTQRVVRLEFFLSDSSPSIREFFKVCYTESISFEGEEQELTDEKIRRYLNTMYWKDQAYIRQEVGPIPEDIRTALKRDKKFNTKEVYTRIATRLQTSSKDAEKVFEELKKSWPVKIIYLSNWERYWW